MNVFDVAVFARRADTTLRTAITGSRRHPGKYPCVYMRDMSKPGGNHTRWQYFCSTTSSTWIIREPCPLCLDCEKAPVRCCDVSGSTYSKTYRQTQVFLTLRKKSEQPRLDHSAPHFFCADCAALELTTFSKLVVRGAAVSAPTT